MVGLRRAQVMQNLEDTFFDAPLDRAYTAFPLREAVMHVVRRGSSLCMPWGSVVFS
jgi:hypothetical protein